MVCDKCGLMLIALLDTDIVVPPSYVYLGKLLHPLNMCYEFRNQG